MFVSRETAKLLLSGKYVRCLQTPTASFLCVSGQTCASPCACSLVLNDYEFCHSPTSGGAGGLRRTANFFRRRRNTAEDEREQSGLCGVC